MKIKKSSTGSSDIDRDMITINNFFGHLIKEISVKKFRSDKNLIPTFSPYEIYQYFDAMLKHLPKNLLKKLEITMLYSKQSVYYNSTLIDWRIHNGAGTTNATAKAINAKDLNIDDYLSPRSVKK